MSEFGNEAFAAVVRRLQGQRTQRSFADRCGVHQTTIHDMLRGKVPSLNILLRVANNLDMRREQRQEWFDTAGVEDPVYGSTQAASDRLREVFGLTYHPEFTRQLLKGLSGFPRPEDVPEVQEVLLEALAEERRKRGAD